MIDNFVNICVQLVGLLLVLIALVGFFCMLLMSLAVLDYIFNTDMKEKLCNKIPHWSGFYKLRKHFIDKVNKLDNQIIENDKKQQ